MARRDRESRKKGRRTDLDKSLGALSDLGGEDYWSPKEGKNTIRILPPWNEEGVFFFKGTLHYGVQGESSAPVPCRENIDKDCPICESLDKIADREVKRRLMKKTRFYMNIIDRGNISAGVKIFGCSTKQMRQLRSQMEDPDFGDITDLDEGHDIVVEKDSQSNPSMPSYDIRVRPKATPLDYDDWEDELHALDEVVIPSVPDEEDYQEIGDKLLEDLGGESTRKGKKAKKKDDEDDDGDKDDDGDDDKERSSKKRKRR